MKDLTVIDFHAHILPSLDHGCKSSKESLEQLTLMNNSGTDIVVATPHFYPHMHNAEEFADRVDLAIEKIREAKSHSIPKLMIGAEVLLCTGMHRIKELNRMCIRGTNLLLIELPFSHISEAHIRSVEGMLDLGYRVLLAHVDRYFDQAPEKIDQLLSMGAVAQINASSLFVRSKRKKILQYLEATDHICAVGSDLHGVDTKAYKKFVKSPKILSDYYPEIMRRSRDLLTSAEIFV